LRCRHHTDAESLRGIQRENLRVEIRLEYMSRLSPSEALERIRNIWDRRAKPEPSQAGPMSSSIFLNKRFGRTLDRGTRLSFRPKIRCLWKDEIRSS
jgi:hypothetical protein